MINGFTITYREAGSNSYFRAVRVRPDGTNEVYTRKDRASLVKFLKSKGSGGGFPF